MTATSRWTGAAFASDLDQAKSYLHEGYDWSTRLLDAAADDIDDRARARLQTGIGGMLCVRTGHYTDGMARLEDARGICERLGDQRGLGWVDFYSGIAGWDDDSLDHSIARFELARETFEATGVRPGQLLAALLSAYAHGHAGHWPGPAP